MANEQAQQFDFEHFNLNEVDPTFHPIEKGVYGLRLGKVAFRVVTPGKGARVGMETPLVDATFSVINHDKYSGRRLKHTFWLTNTFDQKGLKRLSDAIAFPQEPGQSFQEYIESLAGLNPAPEFRTLVDVKIPLDSNGQPQIDEVTGKPLPGDNVMKWNQVLPIN